MADQAVSLKIDEKIVERALELELKQAVARAMDGQGKIVAEIARRIVSQKVDNDGRESTYGNQTLLDHLLKKLLKEQVTELLKAELQKNAAGILDSVKKELGSAKGKRTIARALVEGAADSLSVHWKHAVSIGFRDVP